MGPYWVTEVMPSYTYKLERSGQGSSIQTKACLKPYWASSDAEEQAPPLQKPTHRPTMQGKARADTELEVVVQIPEEAAKEPTDRHQLTPPLVELADAPAVPNEMAIPQLNKDNRAVEDLPIPVEPLLCT